jgi:hypothetical protein
MVCSLKVSAATGGDYPVGEESDKLKILDYYKENL